MVSVLRIIKGMKLIGWEKKNRYKCGGACVLLGFVAIDVSASWTTISPWTSICFLCSTMIISLVFETIVVLLSDRIDVSRSSGTERFLSMWGWESWWRSSGFFEAFEETVVEVTSDMLGNMWGVWRVSSIPPTWVISQVIFKGRWKILVELTLGVGSVRFSLGADGKLYGIQIIFLFSTNWLRGLLLSKFSKNWFFFT